MAIVSYIGHDLRMVDASCNGLTEAFEVDRLGAVEACSMRREAWPTRPPPPFCGTAPFDCANMSWLPLVVFTLQSNLEGDGDVEEEESAEPLSLEAVAIEDGTAGSLEERDDGRSTGGREVEHEAEPAPPLACPFKWPLDFCLVTFFPEPTRPFSCRLL